MATRARYRGFSTQSFMNTGPFLITNQEVVKQDLLNHIYTIPGERPHLPTFGTRIPLLAFEPLDETTVNIIREDLEKVVKYDPRLEMIDLVVTPLPDNNAIVAFMDVRYVELDVTETLRLEFGVGA